MIVRVVLLIDRNGHLIDLSRYSKNYITQIDTQKLELGHNNLVLLHMPVILIVLLLLTQCCPCFTGGRVVEIYVNGI